MGYSTEFQGTLKFVPELTSSQIANISQFFGEDCRDHPEWGAGDLTWMDLELTDDYSGLQWDGSEKTYDMVEKINLIIKHMRQTTPEFTLEGEILAQGEEIGDIWKIIPDEESGLVKAVDVLTEIPDTCPNCGYHLK